MNIVFDLGGVILHWNPSEVIAQHFAHPEERQQVKRNLLKHPDWAELDRGTLALDEAIFRAVSRTGLTEKSVAQFLKNFPRALTPKPEVLNIIQQIHASGQKLFVLSNMHQHAMEYIKQAYDFWDMFEGIVFSSPLKMIKPQPEIYHHLLDKYGLKAVVSVFIDDRDENIIAAEKIGFKTIHFKNTEQFAKALQGILSTS